LAISDVVVHVFQWQTLAGSILIHIFDDAIIPQLRNDEVPFGVRIRVGGVGDLKREPG
jgi:hypothetical protein